MNSQDVPCWGSKRSDDLQKVKLLGWGPQLWSSQIALTSYNSLPCHSAFAHAVAPVKNTAPHLSVHWMVISTFLRGPAQEDFSPSSLLCTFPPSARRLTSGSHTLWCFPVWGLWPEQARALKQTVGNMWSLMKKAWQQLQEGTAGTSLNVTEQRKPKPNQLHASACKWR